MLLYAILTGVPGALLVAVFFTIASTRFGNTWRGKVIGLVPPATFGVGAIFYTTAYYPRYEDAAFYGLLGGTLVGLVVSIFLTRRYMKSDHGT